ncbi:MAG: GNAT family N-acetyltransferase [Candidatus Heimdallarchaeota archaeon]|nr:GNAT family N-acetyltransferase [Candidatus Heimdallarchaeota archaeon]
MKEIQIKELRGDDIDPILEMAFYAFFSSPGNVEQLIKNKPFFKEDLCYALYEDDKVVAGLMLKPIMQNVRGSVKPMCGVAEVVTKPEARRQGYANKLMNLAFVKMKEKGQIFSTLYPFKESFYERLGYISFPQYRNAIFSPSSLTNLLKEKYEGTVERVNIKDGLDIYLDFLEDFQKKTHGMGIKHRTEQDRLKESPNFWLAFAKNSEGKVIGIMTYRITGFWKELKVRSFYHENSLAKYLLLQWLANHADQVREVHLPVFPNDYPETWNNDTFWGEKGKIMNREWVPSCMGRVVIVNKLNGLNVGTGHVSIKIIDEQCEWNNTSYSFTSNNGILEVSETSDYDCELTIQGFSAIIYGCYNLDDFPFKGWGDISEEIKKTIKFLFPPAYPYLHADF